MGGVCTPRGLSMSTEGVGGVCTDSCLLEEMPAAPVSRVRHRRCLSLGGDAGGARHRRRNEGRGDGHRPGRTRAAPVAMPVPGLFMVLGGARRHARNPSPRHRHARWAVRRQARSGRRRSCKGMAGERAGPDSPAPPTPPPTRLQTPAEPAHTGPARPGQCGRAGHCAGAGADMGALFRPPPRYLSACVRACVCTRARACAARRGPIPASVGVFLPL